MTIVGSREEPNLYLGPEKLQATGQFSLIGITRMVNGECNLVEERIALVREWSTHLCMQDYMARMDFPQQSP